MNNVPIDFYLSTDSQINAFDDFQTTVYYNLTRDVPFTTTTNIWIPTGLNINQIYYMGAAVDPWGTLGGTTLNNITFIPIRFMGDL